MIAIARLDGSDPGFAEQLAGMARSAPESDPDLETRVRAIIERVRREGDAALVELTAELDRHRVNDAVGLRVDPARLAAALAALPAAEREALERAAERVRAYHERQAQASWSYREADGTVLGQEVRPLDRVGVYVPGGKAAYPSSVLMNVVPARVAGVGEVVMTVPAPGGELDPMVLAAARVAGVDRVFTVGGAQAVAALAYGTATVPAVDKIVGPGNAWVACAKRQVFGVVGIDMIAGPSEIVIVSDGTVPADWLAMDLFSQAEHDEDARAVLITPDRAHADAVVAAMERALPEMERSEVIRASLEGRGAVVVVGDLDAAVDVVNELAPEHLELSVAEPRPLLAKVRHAGAVFLGRYSAEALGDYCAGPNHVLPTARTARFSSPLGVYDFQKRSSVIECSAAGARALGATASVLARAEGLTAHARSAELRIDTDA